MRCRLPAVPPDRSGPFARRLGAALTALALAVAPPAALGQADNLPRLGDAGGEDLSPAAERRLGEEIMLDIRRDASVSDDPEASDYLNRLGAQLTTSVSAGHTFEFFLVRDATMNAFALPGGFIGVHSGLIIAAQTESELASVLAHEIGHVTQRHIARMLSAQRQTSLMTLAAIVLGALAARSNPMAIGGIATMAGGAQQQQMLSFSRDAEREADRLGLDTLRQAGFDPNGMVAFFGRLQQSSRFYEGSAPAYMRSHPMTGERIADMQARVREGRYRQRADSLEFRLLRAKLRAQSAGGVDALRDTRRMFERQISERTSGDELAAWYGLASTALAQRDFAAAERALAQARKRVPDGHPYLERLAADVKLQAGDPAGALAVAQAGAGRFSGARALVYLQADALLALKEYQKALVFLKDQLALYRSDPVLWRLSSRAHNGLGQTAEAHRAVAEEYALGGAWLGALEQLKLAQRAGGLDFYAASQVDARMRELQALHTARQQERAAR